MSHSIVEVIYSPERNAQVEVFRRDNGTYGFTELRYQENAWIPYGPSDAVFDSAESAIREAKARVDWLPGVPHPLTHLVFAPPRKDVDMSIPD